MFFNVRLIGATNSKSARHDTGLDNYESYQKIGLVRVRQLTEDDYRQRQGIIQSLEGPEMFRSGDYLARGVLNEEWLIASGGQIVGYEPLGGPDEDGFITYRPNPVTRYACQMQEPFVVRKPNGAILSGKAGDYLIRIGDRGRIVDRAVFEQSYQRIDV
ncbi:hypothetical protein KDW_38960 [Dictyobacter vulcani]|uniref:Uncharacterized protein n=1 Tax=Dictyobacter vulcani TaxID=2607529 RepID=A0A5J4KJR2_9CHLR|nr:PGDYG domain-containing protein [Dictyobacter vulcani]GER89734.1 hypothetical protein KDW_38960 [Dictyobacter vulcani]